MKIVLLPLILGERFVVGAPAEVVLLPANLLAPAPGLVPEER
jgi:hypothetical protein